MSDHIISTKNQPWIGKPITDVVFILLPPFISFLIIFLFPSLFQNQKGISDYWWMVLIVMIDVAHVYSTLYRTYFDSITFNKQKNILLIIPTVGFVAGVILFSISSLLFWRLLAYTAVFHFIRQQYGFMRLYSRKEKLSTVYMIIDKLIIYTATIYPILYWHLKGPRNFDWFVEKDFFYFQSEFILHFLTILYFSIIVIYIISEIRKWIINKTCNIPKLGIITGTIVSWYFGIVYYNGDMAFTLLNVISHGIPYMTLIWIYGNKNYLQKHTGSKFLQLVFSRRGILFFLGLLIVFAFLEEGLWDLLVWKEHENIFGNFIFQLPVLDNTILSFIVPLLALPQITHYILDGFIWKIKKDEIKWNNEI